MERKGASTLSKGVWMKRTNLLVARICPAETKISRKQPSITRCDLFGPPKNSGRHVCITKLARKVFFKPRIFSRKMLRNFPANFEPLFCVRKIRAPIKIKSALPPPPPKKKTLKRRNFTDTGFPAERTLFFQVSIKLAQPFPGPELRTRILRTRGFFWLWVWRNPAKFPPNFLPKNQKKIHRRASAGSPGEQKTYHMTPGRHSNKHVLLRTIVKPLWRLPPSEAKNPPVEHQHFPNKECSP